MPFNPIETSLFVTLKSLTQDQSVLLCIAENPAIKTGTLNESFKQNEDFLKQEIKSFTAPPSSLNPYQQIIYRFSKRMEKQFLTQPVKAIEMVNDTLSMNSTSDTMIGLRKEQLRFIEHIDLFLDACRTRHVPNAFYNIQKWRHKNALIRDIFTDSKPCITGDEYSTVMDMADKADEIKNRFKYVNSIYLPTEPTP